MKKIILLLVISGTVVLNAVQECDSPLYISQEKMQVFNAIRGFAQEIQVKLARLQEPFTELIPAIVADHDLQSGLLLQIEEVADGTGIKEHIFFITPWGKVPFVADGSAVTEDIATQVIEHIEPSLQPWKEGVCRVEYYKKLLPAVVEWEEKSTLQRRNNQNLCTKGNMQQWGQLGNIYRALQSDK